MTSDVIDVSSRGGVILGPEVVCDGFLSDHRYRVQTHIHSDHVADWTSSKGHQRILLTEPTREMLIAEQNADLQYRGNIIALPPGKIYEAGGSEVELIANGHMLGSVQVGVTLADGLRLGYSGDFQWPLDRVLRVDGLVVDSTYGSPDSIRRYSQQEAEERFVDLVQSRLAWGPVVIRAHRGTLQRCLELLDDASVGPILATDLRCREAEVYSRFGYRMPPLVTINSLEAHDLCLDYKYVRLVSAGDPEPSDRTDGTRITVSAFMTGVDDPVLEYSEYAYRVAMSGHADFLGTLEYVNQTGARFVVTDNSRGGHGVELANALRERLGVEARPSSQRLSRNWGA